MRRLIRFFTGGERLVKLVGGLPEPEAEMYRTLISDQGIPVAIRNTSSLAHLRISLDNTFELLVSANQASAAADILQQAFGSQDQHRDGD